MIIQREELLSKLKRCLPGVETGNSVFQGADCFIIRNNSILTYNTFMAVTVPFTSDISCAIPAIPFYKTVSSFKAGDITLTQEGNKLKLSCGRAKAEFTTIDEQMYERFLKIMPDAPDWKDLPVNFNTTVKSGILHGTGGGLDGVFFHGHNMLATNFIIIVNMDLGMNMDRVWLNTKAAGELVKLPMLEKYCTNSAWIHFKTGETIFSCKKLIDDNYPEEALLKNFEDFVQSENSVNGTFPAELSEVLKRAAIFAEEEADAHAVHCSIEGNILTVSSSKAIGAFSESVEITRNDTADGKVEWKADIAQFKTAFENNPKASFYVSTVGKRSAMVFIGDNWRQVVGLLANTKTEGK